MTVADTWCFLHCCFLYKVLSAAEPHIYIGHDENFWVETRKSKNHFYESFWKIFKLYDNSNSYTHIYCTVLELKTAWKKVTDLETKIQRMEEQQTEQNHGELLFTIILSSKGVKVAQ